MPEAKAGTADAASRLQRRREPGPGTKGRCKLRHAFPPAWAEGVAPDASCSADHPASCGRLNCGPGRARAVYSARLHSRGIDSIGQVRPLVPRGGGESGTLSRRPRIKEAAPGAPCLTDHPVSRGRPASMLMTNAVQQPVRAPGFRRSTEPRHRGENEPMRRNQYETEPIIRARSASRDLSGKEEQRDQYLSGINGRRPRASGRPHSPHAAP